MIPMLVLLSLSAAMHFVWLSYPPSVIFDEIHFGTFVDAYCCSHERIFDVHPPHAKLLIAAGARALGYRGTVEYDAIGESYGEESPFAVRFVPALAGTFLPALVYILMLQLGGSQSAAVFASLLVLLDNALVLQTRVIALDGILLSATLAALVSVLAAMRTDSHLRRSGYCLLSGVFAGLAAGSKFTGIVALALVAACVFVGTVRRGKDLQHLWYWLRKSIWISTGFVLVYGLGWILHFELLTLPGPGDIWGVPSGNLLADIVETHVTMLTSNIGLAAQHPDSSPWWGWPWMHTPVFYWTHANAKMYLLGNPVVWWGSSVLLIVVLVNLVLFRVSSIDVISGNRRKPVLWIPILGFIVAYLPLSQVSRVLFLYHYFTALVFAVLTVVLWLDYVGWIRSNGVTRQRVSFYLALALVLLAFAGVSPVTYGFEGGTWLVDMIFDVFPRWR